MCIRLCPAGDPESAPSGAAELDAFWSLRKASKTPHLLDRGAQAAGGCQGKEMIGFSLVVVST